MTTIRLPNDRSGREATATVTDEDPPDWERFKLYWVGTMLARKTGETHQRCPKREIYMTHHCLQLESGQRVRVSWRDFLEWAVNGQAQKVHLRRPESVHYVRMAEAGRIRWPQALRRISDREPITEDLEGRPAEVAANG